MNVTLMLLQVQQHCCAYHIMREASALSVSTPMGNSRASSRGNGQQVRLSRFYFVITLTPTSGPCGMNKISFIMITDPSNLEKGVKDSEGGIYDGDRLLKFDNRRAIEYTVKDGTKVICDKAFRASNLSTIILPPTITVIGQSAFAGCCDLSLINIPFGVTELPRFAFSSCDSLRELHLPKSIKNVGTEALPSGLEVLVVNSKIQFNEFAFENTNLEKIIVPDDTISYYETVKERLDLTCSIQPLSESDIEKEDSEEVMDMNSQEYKEALYSLYPEALIKELENCISNGKISKSDRAGILRKAESYGVDTENFNLFIDSKLLEAQMSVAKENAVEDEDDENDDKDENDEDGGILSQLNKVGSSVIGIFTSRLNAIKTKSPESKNKKGGFFGGLF